MLRVEQQPALILHLRPYRETSVLIEALSRDHGRVGLVARGQRRERPRWPRGLLEPLRTASLSWSGRGELGTLTGAEPAGAAPPLSGDALFAGLYLGELLARLVPRHDPYPELFLRVCACLAELGASVGDTAWVLRRFERDLLEHLGYGLELAHDAATGEPLDPEGDYSYDPERGPLPWSLRPLAPSLKGRSLLALAGEATPDGPVLRDLRRLVRAVIRHHLGGRELNAWTVLAPPSGAA